ncbi:MAG TPA: 16S rRNA (uracil(1498)-N(3))-methyltransferase [Pyrinomonadaceae bacterium]|nr:16S rRNA (uracil(1498)-N(3))-methyltransferase [Pyrinomonadaceae bacterium]
MTRRRFYAPPESFAPDRSRVTLAADEARHLRDVLRLRAGDEVYVFDGAGAEYLCEVAEAGRSATIDLAVRHAVEPARRESPLDFTLGVALLKGEKFDLVVQKATELGVSRVVPLVTQRADVRLREERGEAGAAKRAARFARLALEAAKQSGRARLPTIDAPVDLASFLKDDQPAAEHLRVFFSERAGGSFPELSAAPRPSFVTAVVGPEGGWEDAEIEAARSAGWQIVTLGGRILRAETAAIAVAALLQHRYGDFS